MQFVHKILNRKLHRAAVALAAFGVAGLVASSAWAAAGTNSLGTMVTTASTDLVNVSSAANLICYIGGISCVIIAIAAMAGRHKGNDRITWPGIAIAGTAGILFLCLPTMLGGGAESVSGAAAAIDSGSAAGAFQVN